MSKTPHLIAYKLNPVTAFLARHLLKIKYVNLVNILADKEIIPELLQENCNSDKIVETVELLLGESGKNQIELASEQMKKLGADDVCLPSQKAAKEVLRIING
jgi:lipid-A-disaccharide synthase